MRLREERDAGTSAESSSESIKNSGNALNSSSLDALTLRLVPFSLFVRLWGLICRCCIVHHHTPQVKTCIDWNFCSLERQSRKFAEILDYKVLAFE